METSVWRTWKPYAIIAAIGVAAVWWWNAQSPLAQLRDGIYDCVAVVVDGSSQYGLVTEDSRPFTGSALVEGGEVVSYSAPNVLGWRSGVDIREKVSGTTKFHATQEKAVRDYLALACELR